MRLGKPFWAPAAVLLLAACSFDPQLFVNPLNRGKPSLESGLLSYESGRYEEAEIRLQKALTGGLAAKSDQIEAHKYLAFIYCMSGRTTRGREEFRIAFKLNPKFELMPSEAGHPQWGPVYRSIRDETDRGKKKA